MADALPLGDKEGRDRALFMLQMGRKFKKAMDEYMTTGEYSVQRLRELIETKKEGK